MIQCNNFIPQVYGKERDIQVFTKLLDIIINNCKYDIDHCCDVYDAYKCPQGLLPLLAKTLNYEYNFEDTVTSNRRTLAAFTSMERNRGSEVGLKMASALSLTSLDISKNNAELVTEDSDYVNALRDIQIQYDYENATIYINYPNVYTLVRYLLDYVRPVGMRVELRSIIGHNINTDALMIYAATDNTVETYQPEINTFVNRSFVNFSATTDPKWMEQFSEDSTINLND